MHVNAVLRASSFAAVLLAMAAGTADGATKRRPLPDTTSHRTIVGADAAAPYSAVKTGPGWARVVRTDFAQASRRRSLKRTSLLYFGQLSDFQLADEESPARVEALDYASTPFTSAWRPQEALGPQTVDAAIRQVGRFTRSPLRQRQGRFAKLALVLTTGDSADNQQENEVRWTVTLLDGGRLDPNSGVQTAGCGAAGEAARYTGVQDSQDVPESGRFYDPDRPEGAFAAWPRYPGLMDRAQRAFTAAGLPVPSYVAFGNHDGLVQGNAWANAAFDALATGCLKPLQATGLSAGLLATSPQNTVLVPPDPARGFVDRKAYMAIHRGSRQADGHGFGLVDPAEAKASGGQASYYTWTPKPGVRLIAINTVAEGETVGSEGNLDDPQFRWLTRTLVAADAAGELVILFGHHPIRTMTQSDPDESAPACDARQTAGPGCDGDPRSSTPIHDGADLQRLLLAHRGVVAYVAGHTHEHRVTPFPRNDPAHPGGFWGVETASEVDWPINSRLLELMDNHDGTLSLFGTILDHAAPVAPPAAGTAAAGMTETQLASIGREFSFNDPQAGGKVAKQSGVGRPQDRNVELLLRDPRGGRR